MPDPVGMRKASKPADTLPADSLIFCQVVPSSSESAHASNAGSVPYVASDLDPWYTYARSTWLAATYLSSLQPEPSYQLLGNMAASNPGAP